MIRATVIKRISDFLAATYRGPVTILTETSTAEMLPPYAVVRVGSAEELFPGQAEIWDMNILVGVFHDADSTTAATAEAQAAAVFAALGDGADMMVFSDDELAYSAWERNASEASINETNWQHVAGFRAIVAPRF